MNSTKKAAVILPLRIDWSEQDYFGHVNNVSFFKYIQAARVNYWEQIGLAQQHLQTNIGPMLASCQCDFKHPLFYPGIIHIHTHVSFIKNTSFGFEHRIIDEKNNLAAIAKDIMVFFDFNKNEKLVFPELFRKKIEDLEGRS